MTADPYSQQPLRTVSNDLFYSIVHKKIFLLHIDQSNQRHVYKSELKSILDNYEDEKGDSLWKKFNKIVGTDDEAYKLQLDILRQFQKLVGTWGSKKYEEKQGKPTLVFREAGELGQRRTLIFEKETPGYFLQNAAPVLFMSLLYALSRHLVGLKAEKKIPIGNRLKKEDDAIVQGFVELSLRYGDFTHFAENLLDYFPNTTKPEKDGSAAKVMNVLKWTCCEKTVLQLFRDRCKTCNQRYPGRIDQFKNKAQIFAEIQAFCMAPPNKEYLESYLTAFGTQINEALSNWSYIRNMLGWN